MKISKLYGVFRLIIALIAVIMPFTLAAQGVFSSAGTGNWNSSSTWTYTGTDVDGIPDADDNVTIASGHTVTMNANPGACNNLTVTGTLTNSSTNTLNVGANLVLNSGSTITSSSTGVVDVSGTLQVNSGGTSTISRINLSVTGTTQIDGTLSFNNTNGTKTFYDDVTITGDGDIYFVTTETIDLLGATTDLIMQAGSVIDGSATGTINVDGGLIVESVGTSSIGRLTFNIYGESTIEGTLEVTNINGNNTFYDDLTLGTDAGINFTAAETLTLSGTGSDLIMESGSSIGGSATGVMTVGGNLIINSGGTSTIDELTITVSGTVSIDGTLEFSSTTGNKNLTNIDINSGGSWDATANENFAISGDITNDGTFNSGSGIYTLNGATKTIAGSAEWIFENLDIDDTYTNNGELEVTTDLGSSGPLVQGTNSTLRIGGACSITTLTAGSNVNSVIYNGSAAQTVKGTTYYNLEINKTSSTASLGGNTTINGSLTIASGVMTPAGRNLTVHGTTSISGTFTDNSTTGANIFVGKVTLTSTGVWNYTVNETAEFRNGLEFNGTTFTTGAGTYTFSTNSQEISGSKALIFNGPFRISGAITVTNSSFITLKSTLTGTDVNSTFLNKDTVYFTSNAVTAPMSTGILDASFAGNLFNYNRAGAQTIKSGTYYNLIISSSNTKTLGGAITVNGDITVAGTTTFADGGYLITGVAGKTFSLGAGTTYTSTKTTNPCFPSNMNYAIDNTSIVNINGAGTFAFTSTTIPSSFGDLSINGGTFTKTLPSSFPITINGNLTIATGTLADNGNTITVYGDVSNSGTHSGAGKIYLTGGTLHNISGAVGTYGNIELNDASGANFANTSGATVVSGNLTITQGTLTLNNFSTGLTVNGNTSISGTLNISSTTGTKTFGNITVNSGGTWNSTVAEAFSISGNIANTGTFTANTGVYTLTGAGKTLSGSSNISIPSIAISATGTYTNSCYVNCATSLAITTPGSLTNNDTVNCATALSGTGSLIQSANSVLYLRGTTTVGTLNASANPNIVDYCGTATQTIKTGTYYNLLINNPTTSTLGNVVTVLGDLSVNSGIFADGGYGITGIAGKTFTLAAGTAYTSTKTTNPCFPTNMTCSFSNASTVNINGNATIAFTGIPASYGNLSFSVGGTTTRTKTLPASFPITVNGNLTISNYVNLVDNGNTITVKGNITNNGTHSGTGKIYLNGGTGSHSLSGVIGTYGNIELNDTYGATITNTSGTTTVSGNISINEGNLSVGAFATGLTISGTTTISSGSSLLVTSTTGTKIFGGLVTINSGAAWNNTADAAIVFRGGISNYGTFDAGNGTQTFNTSAQFLTGTFSINNITITGIAVTNNDTLTVNSTLGGTGGLTQAANALLNIGFSGAIGVSSLTASANGNTVDYIFAGNQTIKTPATAYYNLRLSDSGTKTLAAATTINGDITIGGSVAFADGTYAITGAVGKTFTLGAGTVYTSTRTSSPFPSNVSFSIDNTSTVNINGAGTFTITNMPTSFGNLSFGAPAATMRYITLPVASSITVNGNLSIGLYNTLYDNGSTIILNGSTFTNNGTFSSTTGSFILGGSSQQTIAGGVLPVFYNLEINNSTPVSAVVIDESTIVNGNFKLTDGHIITSATKSLTLGASATITLSATPDSSFVKGPLKHTFNSTSAVTKAFPIGKGNIFHQANLTLTQTNTTPTLYTGEFFNQSATGLGLNLPASLSKVSDINYWDISNSGASNVASAFVTLNYSDTDYVQDAANLRIAKSSGTNWIDIGGSGTGSPSGSITSTVSFTSFSRFSLANKNGGSNTLPIELLFFAAKPDDEKVELSWATFSEINNDFFTVERSSNGIDFEPYQFIAGAGNSNSLLNYSSIDYEPLSGISFYRLKQTDFDGKFSFSDIVSVEFLVKQKQNSFSAYVTPDMTVLFFNSEIFSNYKFSIYDLSGRLIYNKDIEQQAPSVSINTPTLNQGIYLYVLQNQTNTMVKKVKVQ